MMNAIGWPTADAIRVAIAVKIRSISNSPYRDGGETLRAANGALARKEVPVGLGLGDHARERRPGDQAGEIGGTLGQSSPSGATQSA